MVERRQGLVLGQQQIELRPAAVLSVMLARGLRQATHVLRRTGDIKTLVKSAFGRRHAGENDDADEQRKHGLISVSLPPGRSPAMPSSHAARIRTKVRRVPSAGSPFADNRWLTILEPIAKTAQPRTLFHQLVVAKKPLDDETLCHQRLHAVNHFENRRNGPKHLMALDLFG